MTTTAFPTGRPNYRYKKASKEGRNPGLSRPRRPEVTSGRSSSCPTPCRPLPHLLHCPLCGRFSARPPVRFLGSEPRHRLLGAMALPGDPYQDALINASNSLSASAPDRGRGRGSHSGDRLVRDMALLAVGLDAGHALHHRGRGRVRSRFLLPRPRHAGPSPSVDRRPGRVRHRGGGSVAAPPGVAGGRDRRRRGGRVRVVRWSWSEHGLGSAPGENPPQSLPGRATSSVLGSVRRFGVLSGFVRVSARERRLASWALLPTPSGLSMFPPAPGSGALFALGVPVGASAGE